MKIKVKAEDFIVNEKVDIVYADSGEYYLYSLTKKGFNTLDLLIRLSRRFGIPLYDISYGGKKDRYALTTQHITIKGKRIPDIKERNYTISYLGKVSRPMGPDLINGNEFIVNVRDLNEWEAQKAMGEIEMVSNYGLPNYFDDQRFGSYSPEQGFIAEKILKKHYNGALKIYLTAVYPGDKKAEKERKRFLSEQDLKKSSFNLKKIRRAFFKSFPRPLVVIPVIKGVEVDRDEIYADKKILRLHFELPRGSYGTMLIKRVMADQ